MLDMILNFITKNPTIVIIILASVIIIAILYNMFEPVAKIVKRFSGVIWWFLRLVLKGMWEFLRLIAWLISKTLYALYMFIIFVFRLEEIGI